VNRGGAGRAVRQTVGIPGFLPFRHAGLDPESRPFRDVWIQAFAGVTTEGGATHSQEDALRAGGSAGVTGLS